MAKPGMIMAGAHGTEMAESRWVRTEVVQRIPEIIEKMRQEYRDFNPADIGSFLIQPDHSSSTFTVAFYGKDNRTAIGGYKGTLVDGKLVNASNPFFSGAITDAENVFTGKREGYWYLVAQYDDPVLKGAFGFPEMKSSDMKPGSFYQISYKPQMQKSWKDYIDASGVSIPVQEGRVADIVAIKDVQSIALPGDYSAPPASDVYLRDKIRIDSPTSEITGVQLDNTIAYCPPAELRGQKTINIWFDISTSFQRDIGEGNKVRIMQGMKKAFQKIGEASLPYAPSGFYIDNVEQSSDNYLLWLEQVYGGMQRGDYKNMVIEVAGDGGHVLGLEKRGKIKDAYRDESGNAHDFDYKEFASRFTKLATQNNVTLKFLNIVSDEIKEVRTEYITNKVLEAVVNDPKVSGALQEYFSSGKADTSKLSGHQREVYDKVVKSEKLSSLAKDYFSDLQQNPSLPYVVREQMLEDQVKSYFGSRIPTTLSIRTVIAPGEQTGLPVAANYVMGTAGFEQLISDLGGETIRLHRGDYEADGLIKQDKADLAALQSRQPAGSLPYGTLFIPMETGMTMSYLKESEDKFQKGYQETSVHVKVPVILNE